jgi:uncharacterized protein YbaP (TraB family)
MAKTLVIELPDELENQLESRAIQQNKKIEDLVVEWIREQVRIVSKSEPDPITPLLGTIAFTKSDLAKHHDEYLGAAFYKEVNRVG